MLTLKLLPLLGIILLFNLQAFSQLVPYRFDHVGVEQGLSDSYIEDALQDKVGYLWLATAHGLNRYDGRSCKVYNSIDQDLLSLDHVNGLLIDRNNTLWICSRMNGLLTYNFADESFSRITFSDTSKTDLSYKHSVRQLCESYDGSIWAVSIYGIAQYVPATKRWRWFTQTLDSVSLLRSYTFCITETRDSMLLVGHLMSGNLFYFDRNQQGFRVFKGRDKQHKPLSKSISCVLSDCFGNIWYGSFESGVVCYHPQTGRWQTFHSHRSADSLQSNEIACLYEDSQKTLWVGTINGGLSRFDRKKQSFFTVKNDEMDKTSLSSNSISCLFEDKDKNLCVTTHNGLNILNKRKNLFAFYGKTVKGTEVVSHAQSCCFYQSPNGTMWIGTDGNGLQEFNPRTGSFTVYTTKNGLSSNSILDIEPNSDGQLWLASWGGGVMLFNPVTKRTTTFTPQNSNLNSLNVKGLCRDGDYVWIGTHGQGVNIYDCKQKTIYNKTHPSAKFPFDMGQAVWINDILKDTKGNFWIYTTVGLYRFDGRKMHEYIALQNDSTALSGLHIKHILQDKKGNIWIGANGLDRYNADHDCFERFNARNKDLPSVVNAIAESADGRLWLSSNNGLYSYDYKANHVVRLTEQDGIQGNRFCERSVFCNQQGHIYIGGFNGFNSFDPLTINASRQMPQVHIKSCKILSHSWGETGKEFEQLECIHRQPIEIPYSQSQILTFEFVAATLQMAEQINYAVQMEGFEQMPRQLGSQTSVTYTNLSPGKYKLHVWASNARGIEHSQPTELAFEILRPWYMSLFFKILITLIIAVFIILYFYMRTRWVIRRNIQLSKMVSLRTAQLNEQNSLIGLKNKELSDTIQTRDQLLAIVSHDMKNPLNALCGFASILENQFDRMSVEKQKLIISNIYHSSDTLQKQLIALLDWAVTQTGSLAYEPQDCNLRIVVLDVISLFQAVSDQKNISIDFQDSLHKTVYCDTRMISTVIRNLLGNSLKFTNNGGSIIIKLLEKDSMALLCIEDTGIGIAPDKLDTLFTEKSFVVSYGTNLEKGIGLGLKICKEFIDKNKGTIAVQSVLGEGTIIAITLPLGTTMITAEPLADVSSLLSVHSKELTHSNALILIVEDNKEIQAFLKHSFDGQYSIELAANGEEGFAKALANIPDVILSDIEMPRMSGIVMCQKIKENAITAHIPIVIVSGNRSINQQIEGLRLGVDDYITKPFNVDLLKVKIEQLLKNRERSALHLQTQLHTSETSNGVLSADQLFLQEFISLIEKYLAQSDLSVEFLAEQMNVSRQQISRKLKAVIGQTPVDFIRSYRLKKAANLLQLNRYRVSEIAYEVGFNDPKYFTTCFTKEFGVPPSQYVKEGE